MAQPAQTQPAAGSEQSMASYLITNDGYLVIKYKGPGRVVQRCQELRCHAAWSELCTSTLSSLWQEIQASQARQQRVTLEMHEAGIQAIVEENRILILLCLDSQIIG